MFFNFSSEKISDALVALSGWRLNVGEASYYIWNPAIHDIVTFRDPTQHCEDNTNVNFIKRVVAKEGDTVEVLIINVN
ncbi:unnamed protein product [Trifolium pratense]|uniref:Uncharacterized protein n=1 Tax=Trifolium pratense TaxID=57577 RepID=A0ACB0LKN2_TRIPR|nr:unnamed protein product [Trifolium pratense]